MANAWVVVREPTDAERAIADRMGVVARKLGVKVVGNSRYFVDTYHLDKFTDFLTSLVS